MLKKISYSSDLDNGIGCIFRKCADGNKLSGEVVTIEGSGAVKRGLDGLKNGPHEHSEIKQSQMQGTVLGSSAISD